MWSGVDLTVEPGEFVAVLGPNGVGQVHAGQGVLGLLPPAPAASRCSAASPARRTSASATCRSGAASTPSCRSAASTSSGSASTATAGAFRCPVRAGGAHGAGRRGARPRGHRAGRRAARTRDRPIGQLSGGEQQRLLIAQALAARPGLLLLDEPLDSLDLPEPGAIAALISRICRDDDVTVLMVAHDVNPILSYLDRVVYLAAGGVAAGTPAEVITDETLTRLYRRRSRCCARPTAGSSSSGSPSRRHITTSRHEH